MAVRNYNETFLAPFDLAGPESTRIDPCIWTDEDLYSKPVINKRM